MRSFDWISRSPSPSFALSSLCFSLARRRCRTRSFVPPTVPSLDPSFVYIYPYLHVYIYIDVWRSLPSLTFTLESLVNPNAVSCFNFPSSSCETAKAHSLSLPLSSSVSSYVRPTSCPVYSGHSRFVRTYLRFFHFPLLLRQQSSNGFFSKKHWLVRFLLLSSR